MGMTAMVLRGLDPEKAARIAPLVAECAPLLESQGMDAVQERLSERRVPVMDAIMATTELLGAGPGSLAEAKTLVLHAPSRATERRTHEEFTRGLVRAAEQLADEDGDSAAKA